MSNVRLLLFLSPTKLSELPDSPILHWIKVQWIATPNKNAGGAKKLSSLCCVYSVHHCCFGGVAENWDGAQCIRQEQHSAAVQVFVACCRQRALVSFGVNISAGLDRLLVSACPCRTP